MYKDAGALLFVPHGGLGNRLRAFASAWECAEREDAVLHVVWFKDSAFPCEFTHLFEPVVAPRIRYHGDLGQSVWRELYWKAHGRSTTPWIHFPGKMLRNLPLAPFVIPFSIWLKRKVPDPFIHDPELHPASAPNFTFDGPGASESFYRRQVRKLPEYRLFGAQWRILRICTPFTPEFRSYLRKFRPLDSFTRQSVQVLPDSQASRTVGVHIRRGDLASTSRKNSPTQLFMERMREEIHLHPETLFFLATDDPSEEREMLDTFGDRVKVRLKRSLSRTSVEGAEDALVDFITLGRCREVWGTYGSSFSETAAAWGSAPFTPIFSPIVPPSNAG